MGSCTSFTTIREGDAYALWTKDGRVKIKNGPTRVWEYGKKLERIEKYMVTDSEYLEVIKKTGEKEFVVMFKDPKLHDRITVKSIIKVSENQALAIYNKNGSCEIVHGPTTVLPEDRQTEFLRNYSASDEQYLSVEYLSGKREFKVGPIKMYFDKAKHKRIAVCAKWKVKSGERVGLWSITGKIEIVDGPASLVVGEKKLQSLPLHTVSENEYLRIEYLTGEIQHVKGPKSIFFDPVKMSSVNKFSAHKVNGNEVIIVYRGKDIVNAQEKLKRESSKKILKPIFGGPSDIEQNRKIIRGPCLYVMQPNEWLHRFSWHGKKKGVKNVDPADKHPHALKFTNLRTTADQFYFNVKGVRTMDDALLTCKIMIFFELVDLEKMLRSTLDPIGDIINAATADVVAFATNLSYDLFVEKTTLLNELKSYPQLMENSKKIGYEVSKVVYRGYESSQVLEDMHTKHIEKRTQLRLNKETEERAQELEDLKLMKELERRKRRMKIEKEQKDHENLLNKLSHEEKMRQMKVQNAEEIRQEKLQNDELFRKLLKLGELKVDVNDFLLTEKKQKPDKLIQIMSGKSQNQMLKLDLKE